MKDIVCGMEVNSKSPFKSEWSDKIYHFCSQNCQTKFIDDPLDESYALDLIRHIRKNEVMYKAQAALISCFIKIPLAAFISLSTTIFSSLIVFLPPSLKSITPSQERVLEV